MVEWNAPKGQQAHSPMARPWVPMATSYEIASKRQKLLPFQGVCCGCANTFPQGVALGYEVIGLSGRYCKIGEL